MKGYWAEIRVRHGTPLIVTPEILASCRSHVGKRGYSYKHEVACEEHQGDDWFGDRFSYSCPDCHVETVTYSDDALLQSAIKSAKQDCNQHTDTWVVDTDTNKIVAAFTVEVKSLLTRYTYNRCCPVCQKPVEGTNAFPNFDHISSFDRAGVLFDLCPHCDTLLRIQQEITSHGMDEQRDYRISIAGAIDL